jgi:hypothetical protein
MTLAELKRRMAVGTRWRTEFLSPLRPDRAHVLERTITRHQSNGAWFSPTQWSDREGFLDWPKASCIAVEDDGSITLSLAEGRPFARYWQLT